MFIVQLILTNRVLSIGHMLHFYHLVTDSTSVLGITFLALCSEAVIAGNILYNVYFVFVLVRVVAACSAVIRKTSSLSSFRCDDIEVIECAENQRHHKPDLNELIFGAQFSDHMFEVP